MDHPVRTSCNAGSGTVWAMVCMLAVVGCGTMKNHNATEQLLMSDAVERSVSQIDFSPLSGAKVYLDTTYMRRVNGVGVVNSEYVISSIRERMVAARCILLDDQNQADYVAEVRVGALGTDGHEVNYGLPGSRALATTASLFASSAVIPTVPEISFARKDERRAAAKIAVFAYHRETKEPIGPPTMVKGESLSKSTWVLGAGPFQRGTIYDETQFAGAPLDVPDNPLTHITHKANWPRWPRWLRVPWQKTPDATELARRPPRLVPPGDIARQSPAGQPPAGQLAPEGRQPPPDAEGDSPPSDVPGATEQKFTQVGGPDVGPVGPAGTWRR